MFQKDNKHNELEKKFSMKILLLKIFPHYINLPNITNSNNQSSK
jgi:hypothetical protein